MYNPMNKLTTEIDKIDKAIKQNTSIKERKENVKTFINDFTNNPSDILRYITLYADNNEYSQSIIELYREKQSKINLLKLKTVFKLMFRYMYQYDYSFTKYDLENEIKKDYSIFDNLMNDFINKTLNY